MKPIYAISFYIRPIDGNVSSCSSQIQQKTFDWIENKYAKWGTTLKIPYSDFRSEPILKHQILVKYKNGSDCAFVGASWKHPDEQHAELFWQTDVTIANDNEKAWFSIQTSIIAEPFRPAHYKFGTPNIVRTLAQHFECFIQAEKVSNQFISLSANRVEDFVTNVLLSPARELPIVVISPDFSGKPTMEPDLLLRNCVGLCKVALLEDRWATWKLTDILGKQLSCYNGAIRIYWPGMRDTDIPFRHKLFLRPSMSLAYDTRQTTEDEIFQRLARLSLLADNSSFGKQIELQLDRVRNENILAESKQGKAENEQLLAAWTDTEKQLSEQKSATKDLQDKLIQHELEIDEKNGEIAALKKEIDDLKRSIYQIKNHEEIASAVDDSSDSIDNVKDLSTAIAKAEKFFNQTLVFHERAKTTASESPFRNPTRVYELFIALDELCQVALIQKGSIGTTWKDFLDKKGFEYKPDISSTTKGKYAQEYMLSYNGMTILLQEHVTIGKGDPQSCISIHFYRDETARKLVIGHCGKHLSNTKT